MEKNKIMQIRIEPLTPKEADYIFRFVNALEKKLYDKSLFEKIYLSNIRNPAFIYLGAFIDNHELAGYISCHGQQLLHHCGTVFEIQEMFVQDPYRNSGIGGQLIQSLIDVLKTRDNCVSIEVTANLERSNAHRFYLRNGFRETHRKFVLDFPMHP